MMILNTTASEGLPFKDKMQTIFSNIGHWFMETFNISEHMIRDLIIGGIVCVIVIVVLSAIGGDRA